MEFKLGEERGVGEVNRQQRQKAGWRRWRGASWWYF